MHSTVINVIFIILHLCFTERKLSWLRAQHRREIKKGRAGNCFHFGIICLLHVLWCCRYMLVCILSFLFNHSLHRCTQWKSFLIFLFLNFVVSSLKWKKLTFLLLFCWIFYMCMRNGTKKRKNIFHLL